MTLRSWFPLLISGTFIFSATGCFVSSGPSTTGPTATGPTATRRAPAKKARQNNRDVRQDRREQRLNSKEKRDDRRDLRQLKEVLVEFDKARANNNTKRLARIDERVKTLLRLEAQESGREAHLDRQEVRKSAREARGDRRDLRDDKRDLAKERRMHQRRSDIGREYTGLAGRMDPQSLNRKRALITELIKLAKVELRHTNQEIREDRRERREDRRRP